METTYNPEAIGAPKPEEAGASRYRVTLTERNRTLTLAQLTPDQVGRLLAAVSDQLAREAAQGQPSMITCAIEPEIMEGVKNGESSAA